MDSIAEYKTRNAKDPKYLVLDIAHRQALKICNSTGVGYEVYNFPDVIEFMGIPIISSENSINIETESRLSKAQETFKKQALYGHELETLLANKENRLSKAQELPSSWRKRGNESPTWIVKMTCIQLADELESALKGDESNIGNENKQSITEWLIENALKGNNNNALIDVIEGRTKSFKNTDDLFEDLDGEPSKEGSK